MTEAAFLSAIRLHVTGNLALIRAAGRGADQEQGEDCAESRDMLLTTRLCKGKAHHCPATVHVPGAYSDKVGCQSPGYRLGL